MHILLVEDDANLGMLVQYKLNKEFHNVEWTQDVETAQQYINLGSYDLYILDWMLPSKSGLDFCRELRQKQDKTPILMLTARDAVSDRVEGLNSGADDYLIKPFAFEELLARIHALGRRNETGWTDEELVVGNLRINLQTHHVQRGKTDIVLTRREFQLLSYLMKNSGIVLSREQIIDMVWGLDAAVTPNAVDASIKLLRKKMDDPFTNKMIRSVRGLGYRLTKGEPL